MKDIIITGLSESYISKLLPEIDNVELGYSVITGVMLIPISPNKTDVIFLECEKYNKSLPIDISGIFKMLSD